MSILDSSIFDEFSRLEVRRDLLLKAALFSFIVVSFNFNETGLMPVFALFLLIALVSRGVKLVLWKAGKFPIELKLLNLWVLWSLFTGFLVSVNKELFLHSFTSVFQMVATVNMFYLILAYDIKLLKLIVFAVLICGIMQLAAIYLGFQPSDSLEKERQYGMAGNPNSFGLKMVFSSISVLIFVGYKKAKSMIWWGISIALLFLFLKGILDSGSRKSALAFLILIIGFIGILRANKKFAFKFSYVTVSLLLLWISINIAIPQIIEGTVLGQRFESLEEKGGIESDIRFHMYKFGLELFTDYPFFGVGLNNYREYFYSGQYSHSDYIESLTSTGFFGFILYQSFFLIAIFRGLKALKSLTNRKIRFYVAMSVLTVIVLKVIGLGIILYTSPATMIIMICVVSYLHFLSKKYNPLTIEMSNNNP